MDPAAVIRCEASRRNDTVDMGMREQVLPLGVENAEDADFRAQVLGGGRDFQESGGGGREQEMIKLPGVVLRQEVELVGYRDDHVKARGRQ